MLKTRLFPKKIQTQNKTKWSYNKNNRNEAYQY